MDLMAALIGFIVGFPAGMATAEYVRGLRG